MGPPAHCPAVRAQAAGAVEFAGYGDEYLPFRRDGRISWPGAAPPADRRSVPPQSADITAATTNRGENQAGRWSWSPGPPADGGAIGPKAAPTANGSEPLVRGRNGISIIVVAPANGGPILAQSAGMAVSAAYGLESLVGRRTGLSIIVAAPANGGPVAAQSAGMTEASAHSCETLSGRQLQLPVVVRPPTDRRTVRAQSTDM